MLWKEIKTWAKSYGYTVIKDKDDSNYYWAKLDCQMPESSGVSSSVSKLAASIYNHMTNNKWIEHQNNFKNNQIYERISLTDYGS